MHSLVHAFIATAGCLLICGTVSADALLLEPITPLPPPPLLEPGKLALGELLFHDNRLSRDNSRSCASCHDLSTNGATRNVRDVTPEGDDMTFNTTSVFNAALNFRLGWKGLFRNIEAHALASIQNPAVMGAEMSLVAQRLRSDPVVTKQFWQVYGRAPDSDNIVDALATFVRSLVTPGGRFDRWLQGDTGALSNDELAGYRLFKSLGCISCHQGANVGGNMFQRYGIFGPATRGEGLLVRVPSLRNVALTSPYFHDGGARTLEEAVQDMAAAQLNFELSQEQTRLLVAFLNSLTGNYRGRVLAAER